MFSHLKRNWVIHGMAYIAQKRSSEGGDSLFPKRRAKLDNVERIRVNLTGQNGKKRAKAKAASATDGAQGQKL